MQFLNPDILWALVEAIVHFLGLSEARNSKKADETIGYVLEGQLFSDFS